MASGIARRSLPRNSQRPHLLQEIRQHLLPQGLRKPRHAATASGHGVQTRDALSAIVIKHHSSINMEMHDSYKLVFVKFDTGIELFQKYQSGALSRNEFNTKLALLADVTTQTIVESLETDEN